MRAASMLAVLAVAAAPAQSLVRPIAITSVTVIDLGAGAAVPGMTVIIRDGRIASVGARDAVPRDAAVLDGRGKFLMPGLWDMHVHLGFARESAFPAFVANGVTAVRDLGGDLSEIDRWRAEIAPGFSLHDELDLLVGAGLPPVAALGAATSNPAAMFPQLETGSIAPGRRADLVLLDANPLIDIRNARRIRAVVLAGKLLDRPALDRLLAEALWLAEKH